MALDELTESLTEEAIAAEVEIATLNSMIQLLGRNALSVLLNLAAKKLDKLDARTPKYAVLSSNFNTASTTLVDVTDLQFNVVDGATYSFEFAVVCSTNAATEGFGHGLAVPNGILSALSEIQVASGAAGQSSASLVASNTAHTVTGVVGVADARNYARINGLFRATADGAVQYRLRTETGGANSVTIYQGSYVNFIRVL